MLVTLKVIFFIFCHCQGFFVKFSKSASVCFIGAAINAHFPVISVQPVQ